MPEEIERKFLVKGDFKAYAGRSARIIQGYLSSVPERMVRVRLEAGRGWLTIKGPGDNSGLRRFEWESEIAEADAVALLKLCEPGVIEKIRHYVKAGRHTFEVDEFLGENQGLVIAEIELTAADEVFEKPAWLDREVTGEEKYYNLMLMKRPYSKW